MTHTQVTPSSHLLTTALAWMGGLATCSLDYCCGLPDPSLVPPIQLPGWDDAAIRVTFLKLRCDSVTTTLKWTPFNNYPLPIRKSPTKIPEGTHVAVCDPSPVTSTILPLFSSPTMHAHHSHGTKTHNQWQLPECAIEFVYLCLCTCCSLCLGCFLPLLYPFIKLLSKLSLKCYLPLKPSLIFSDNWSPPPLSSRTYNTKWQILIYRFLRT